MPHPQQMIRSFICFEIPAAIKECLREVQSSLRQLDAQISWVKPENIHLTLKFLGDVSASRLPSVTAAIERAAASIAPFELEVSGAGCFPSARSPRVLWVGLSDLPPSLAELHKAMEAELASVGFARESKKFSPHLTIGRVRAPRNAALVAEQLLAGGFAAQRFTAREVILMRSDLNPAGSIYTPQAAIKLSL